jgi:hypothetical protein
MRRIEGALAGGAVFGVIALFAVALGEARSWWRVPKANSSLFQLLLWLGVAVSCVPVYLLTWRVARRFGRRGLAACILAAAIIGPPRDYFFAATFPAWMIFSTGFAPVLAVATIYALLVVVGHAVMRLVAGPAQGDSLAWRPSGAENTLRPALATLKNDNRGIFSGARKSPRSRWGSPSEPRLSNACSSLHAFSANPFVTRLEHVQFGVSQLFYIHHLISRRVDRMDQLIELEINGAGVPVLSILDEKYH